VPIPVGPTLTVINETLLAQMDARLDTKRDAAGQTIGARFTEEQRQCRLAPTPLAPEATTFATVSPRALVRLEGAYFSVPTRWAALDLIVTSAPRRSRSSDAKARGFSIRGSGSDSERLTTAIAWRSSHASRKRCARCCRISCGIWATRFERSGISLHAEHGPREAARLFAKVLGQLDMYGAAVVVPALASALATGTPLLLALTPA
jgi:hypothetical protein